MLESRFFVPMGVIEVNYENRRFRARHATFAGWTAQIIQHEVDHCNGIII